VPFLQWAWRLLSPLARRRRGRRDYGGTAEHSALGKKVIMGKMTIGAVLGVSMGLAVAAPASAFMLHNKGNSNVCLGVAGGDSSMANGTALIVWGCDSNALNQRWSWAPFPGTSSWTSAYKELKNGANSNKCLDVSGEATNNGAALNIWDCDSTRFGQGWFSYPADPQGCLYIENYNSARWVGVAGGNVQQGKTVVQWDQLAGHNDQLWCPQ